MQSSTRFRSSEKETTKGAFVSQNYSRSKENTKLRLMCSNGGHIVPRPHDKSLCYIGGETRLLMMDRDTTLLELTRHISKTLIGSTSPSYTFKLKYKLPSQDLDSLVSLTNEVDFENMIEEYERLNSFSQIRLFVFRTNPESFCLVKSDDWFVEALNGGGLGVSDSSSVKWLVNLDDEIYAKQEVHRKCHSVPDSLMMETSSSSFGSTSSSPSVANLLPIPEVFLPDHSILSDLTNTSNQSADPNDSPDQTTTIQLQQHIQNPSCLLSMPTTQITQPLQYIQHQPSGAVPVSTYQHHPPMDHPNFVYYMPTRQQPQVYSFPLQQLQTNHVHARPVEACLQVQYVRIAQP